MICIFGFSIEKKVGDVMKQAFWDALQEKLREEPPDFSHAIVLLEEVKQVCDFLPQIYRLRKNCICSMNLLWTSVNCKEE